MSYIGNAPISAAFLVDTFSGTGSQTAFTMTVAPANTSSIIVAVTGVLQDPSTYSVSGTTLTFSAAPPSGTSNISVRYLGIPASGVTTTAYRTVTEFTATSGQTSFSVASYTVGYIDVYRNGVMLGTADFTATTGTTVVLGTGATTGDLIRTESFYVSSVLNAIPATANSVARTYMPVGSVLQVVQSSLAGKITTSSGSFVTTGLSATITPTTATSKILATVTLVAAYTNAANREITATLYNGATNLAPTGSGPNKSFSWLYNPSAATGGNMNFTYLDSPSTTSPTTYTVYYASPSAASVDINENGQTSFITLQEIAA
jgi:hypothetical protein